METECGKSATNVVLWSDSMGTQFRSRFIFQLLAGTTFLNRSLCWFYNGWRRRNHQKRLSLKSKVRSDCGPYTQRLFWCCHEICADIFRNSQRSCYIKNVFLLQNLQENTFARVSFLMKLQDSGTGVFLWISRNFQEHLFHLFYFCIFLLSSIAVKCIPKSLSKRRRL